MTDDAGIERIACGLIDRTLPKQEWTHRAHFAAALWLLSHPDVLAKAGGMAPIIRRYNEATGVRNTDSGGYHETITQASLRMAARALAEAEGAPLSAVLAGMMAGPCGRSGWIFDYWTKERLMSPEARREWTAPDIQSLPD
mgnify:CR=1 FL=1